ncbi:hypothetical protein BDZ45DRAFT_672552 [Acephala macrosclerotiorum]|nr:hypothetical protein BDZ45DRAFT_672552 [Acephala macrosclerotiorum]
MSNTTAATSSTSSARDTGIVVVIVLSPFIVFWFGVWVFSGPTWKGFFLSPLYIVSPVIIICWFLYLVGKISFEKLVKPCWKYTRTRPGKIKEYSIRRAELARDRNAKAELQKVVDKQLKVEERRRAAGPVMTEMLDMGDVPISSSAKEERPDVEDV